jgi:GTPase-activating protein BEM2
VSLSPSLGTPPSGASVPMLHVRSHSFTPKLPSKLSASKVGPPSPSRKASNASERGYDLAALSRERVGMAPPVARVASPFAFGSNNKVHTPDLTIYDHIPSPTGDTPLLPPPQIIEPSESDPPDPSHEKRVSQITFHSGFVNRATEFTFSGTRGTTYGQPATAKGWKPSKLILRGTKLQFYKPPSDRAAAIKELFPVGIVPADEEEVDTSQGEEAVNDKTKLNAMPPTRRKRAFWGRRTHPDLVLDTDGTVESGSLEALVHEAVFATTFATLQETTSNDVQQPPTQKTGLVAWQDFALSVLFALPLVLAADKAEFEFMRCCTYLVSGADTDKKEGNRTRVAWLAGEYLRFHGNPVDEAAWGDFRRETIPHIIPQSSELLGGPSLPASVSLQALYAQSPSLQPSSSPNTNTVSPNVGTFSPRPDNHGMMSLQGGLMMDSTRASGLTASPSGPSLDSGHKASGSGNSQDISFALLDRDGFTNDVLLRFKVQDIAHSLFLFNRHLLEDLPENLTAGDCLVSTPAHIERQAHALQDSAESRSIIRHFLGSEARLHWLTKLVLLHVLMPDSSSGARGSTPPGDPFSRASRTYTRSEVVSTWARIGELCRIAGDECSWHAIFNALCSRPVARLGKTWRRVDPGVRTFVDGWVAMAGRYAVENKLTFWGGDACERMRASLDKAKLGEGDSCFVRFLRAAKDDFEGFRTAFSLCPRKSGAGKDGWTKAVQALFDTWRVLSSSEEGAGGLCRKFVRHVLSLPDRCELLTPLLASTNLYQCPWQQSLAEWAYTSPTFGQGLPISPRGS